MHRLISIPLTEVRFENEKQKIKQIASINGFEEKLIEQIIVKHLKKKRIREITTLENTTVEFKRQKIHFHPNLSKEMRKLFKKYKIDLVEVNEYQISRYLCNNKDQSSNYEKSGIYEISCDCGVHYIGQSRRAIKNRFSEHINLKNKNNFSPIADHIKSTSHTIKLENLQLVEEVHDNRRLDALESFYIQKYKKHKILLNQDNGPLQSLLLK